MANSKEGSYINRA